MDQADRPDDLRTRAENLFGKISKRANLHGQEFTMMSMDDEEAIAAIEQELEFIRVER